jgi:branched-chain amino acid transport system substrate-binding protein
VKKIKPLFFILCLLTLVATLPFASACSSEPEEAQILKVGAIFSLTGPAGPGCITLMDGVKIAAGWINDNGGVEIKGKNYLIEVIGEDDMSTPPGALNAVNKLIFQDEVKFIIAPILLPCNMSIAPVTEEAKVIRMKPTTPGGLYEVNPDMRYHFAAYSQEYNVGFVYDYLVQNYPQAKKIAMVWNDDEGGRAGMEADVKAAAARGLEVVFNESYPLGTEDFYPILTRALAKNPDAIDCVNGLPHWQAGIIKQARELGFTGPMFAMGATGDLGAVLHLVGPEFANDVFIADFDPNGPGMPSMIQEIGNRVKQETDAIFTISQVDAWSSLWALVQGIEKAQSLDTDDVVATMEKMSEIETPFGMGRMGGQELYGINRVIIRPSPLSRFVNGQMEFIGFYEP